MRFPVVGDDWRAIIKIAKVEAAAALLLNVKIVRVLADPGFKEKFLGPNQLQPIIGSPDAFTQYVEADAAKWGKVVKDAKITVE